jgi:hypothetical protein
VRFRKALGDALKVLEHLQEYQKKLSLSLFFWGKIGKNLSPTTCNPSSRTFGIGKNPTFATTRNGRVYVILLLS